MSKAKVRFMTWKFSSCGMRISHCEKPWFREWPVVIKDRGEPEGCSGTIKGERMSLEEAGPLWSELLQGEGIPVC